MIPPQALAAIAEANLRAAILAAMANAGGTSTTPRIRRALFGDQDGAERDSHNVTVRLALQRMEGTLVRRVGGDNSQDWELVGN